MPKGVAAKECADRRTLLRPVGADMERAINFKKNAEKTCEAGETSDGRNIRVVFNIFIIHHLFVCLSCSVCLSDDKYDKYGKCAF